MKKFFIVTTIMLLLISCGEDTNKISNADDTVDQNKTSDDPDETEDAEDTKSIDETDKDDAGNTDEDSGNDTDTADTGNTGDTDNTGDTGETCQTAGEKRIGETVCGSTNKGNLYQECTGGVWTDTGKCTCDPGKYPEVCGTYGQKMWYTANSKVATINMAEAWTRTFLLIEQEQEKELIHIKAKICSIKIDNSVSGLMKMNMPQTFADALPILPKESTLVDNGDGTFGFTQGVFWELRSIDPNCYGDNPAGYTIPDKTDDPCAQDWDDDGVPGLYIKATGTMGGDIHIVQKSSSEFINGWFSADGQTAGGEIGWTDEQNVLQTTNSLLKSGALNSPKDSSSHFDGPTNYFEQVKIAEGSDCAYVVLNAAALFFPDPINIDD